jgi:hypothetical protein
LIGKFQIFLARNFIDQLSHQLRGSPVRMEVPVRIDQCNNVSDFRSLARHRLPGPIFHYIDGAADDEIAYRRNTEAYERCDLVPNCGGSGFLDSEIS